MINSLSYQLTKQPNTTSEEVFKPNPHLIEFIEGSENKNSRILVIKASNSSGKSFLLNSLAHIFNGLELTDEELTPTLKRSINYLIDEQHQTFDFNISINDPEGFVLDTSYNPKSKSKIVLKRANGADEKLNTAEFIQKYKLLYDIPEKPLDRIYQLLKSIKDFNSNLLNKLNPLDIKIDKILTSIKDERNEETIKRIENRININKQHIASYQLSLDNTKSKLKNLKNQINLSKLKKLLRDSNDCSEEYKKMHNELKNLKPPKGKIPSLQKKSLINEIKISIRNLNISNKINYFKEDLENNDYSDQILNNFSQLEIKNLENFFIDGNIIIDLLYDNEIEKVYKFIQLLNSLKEFSFYNSFNALKSNLNEDDYNLIKDLEKALIKYKEQRQNNLIINEIFNKNLNELLNELGDLESKYSEIDKINNFEVSINDDIKNIITSIKEGCKYSKTLFKEQKKLKKEPDETRLYNKCLEKKDILSTRSEKYVKEIRDVRYSLEISGIPLEELNSVESVDKLLQTFYIKNIKYSGKELDSINELELEIAKNEDLIEATKKSILDDDAKFRVENTKQNSSYSDYQNIIQIFSNKLSYFTQYLNQNNALISENGELNSTISKTNVSYVKIIGEFVASLMDKKILYQGNTVNIAYIDYLSQTPCFVTEENNRIAFSDFSGGQGSSNYLKAKLNLSDDRKYIVLLDEISNMDKKSLNEVIKKLKIMEKNNKLLLAILVEPAQEENVFNIEAY